MWLRSGRIQTVRLSLLQSSPPLSRVCSVSSASGSLLRKSPSHHQSPGAGLSRPRSSRQLFSRSFALNSRPQTNSAPPSPASPLGHEVSELSAQQQQHGTPSGTPPLTPPLEQPKAPAREGRVITPETLRKRFRRNLFRLIKLELNALVCVTSAAGYLLGGGSLFEPMTLASVCLGTMSLSIAASVMNQLWERKHDAQMNRTRTRPLVTGYFSTRTAVSLAAGTFGLGTGLLWLGTTPYTTMLGAATVGLYVLVYTPMKRVHRWNTEVGAVVGALPPIMGWLASPGHSFVSPEAFLLGSLLYSWQMSHFMCICWNSRADYARAGYKMISHPDFDPTGIKTVRKGMAWTLVMACLPVLSTLLEITTPMFMISGSVVNLYFCHVYWQFYRQRLSSPVSGRRALRWGFLQLVLFMMFMVFHLKDRDTIRAYSDLQKLRDIGYSFCLHRFESLHSAWKAAFCPFVSSPALAAGIIEDPPSSQQQEPPTSTSISCPIKSTRREE